MNKLNSLHIKIMKVQRVNCAKRILRPFVHVRIVYYCGFEGKKVTVKSHELNVNKRQKRDKTFLQAPRG